VLLFIVCPFLGDKEDEFVYRISWVASMFGCYTFHPHCSYYWLWVLVPCTY